MKPCCKEEPGCRGNNRWHRWGRRVRLRGVVGAGLIFIGLLVLVASAPEWLAGLMVACLLVLVGAICIGGSRF